MTDYAVQFKNGALVPIGDGTAFELSQLLQEGDQVTIKVVKSSDKKIRTLAQNAAMWLYLTMLADKLWACDVDVKMIVNSMKETFRLQPTKDTLMDLMWRPIMKALFNHTSTTQMQTGEPKEIYEHINRFTAEQFGVSIEFPSDEILMMRQYNDS